MNEENKCYICEMVMEFIEELEIEILGKCKKYKCPKCGEIIYHPLSKF